jgi:hypothetical protein
MSGGATTLLELISNNKRLPKINTEITQQGFNKALKKWSGNGQKERPHHLVDGTWCMFADDRYEYYDEENQDPSKRILGVYYAVATSALHWGISLERWKTSITAMIEKQPGCPRINKLRVIHLYEADYNLLLKILWARRLVWQAHDLGKLNEGQARSRPGRNSIDVVIQKEMKHLYAILTRTGLATMDNDAKSCYDRIICNYLNILEFQKKRQLCNLKHYNRCAFGFERRSATQKAIIHIHLQHQYMAQAKEAALHRRYGC